ncbi:MAG: hypothetical protein Q4D57_05295 [Clostridia bacterium]|nr:hypothetical protein [Clostridia bacterium]
MSKNYLTSNDTAWKNFISTGSVYDYLEYKSEINGAKNSDNKAILNDNMGAFCENGNKRDSN